MKKKLILILAATCLCCAVRAGAAVQYTSPDSVRYNVFEDAEQMLQPLEPTYHKGVYVASPWSGNWFVTVQGGASAFIGRPIGCADLFDRVKPTLSVSLGKWFTPQLGARLGYGGWQFKDCQLDNGEYHHFHADLMWNVLGSQYGRTEDPRWGIVPYVGLGLMHNPQNGGNPFAVSYGVQGRCRVCRRLSVVLEIGNVTTFQDFDGYGRTGRLGDNMLSLSAGLSFSFGRVGWKRAVDATPYIRQNEWLIDYAMWLSDSNREYAEQHERDARTLNELKKILDIEGLLDKYGVQF